MRVSVIVPVYNTQNYLPECIDSVLAQTFGDFELILVDDGSTDDSPQICDDYAARDPRVRVIHQKNAGPAAARNAGLDHAQGEYILFADSDDRLLPNLTAVVHDSLAKTNADCLGWQTILSDADGQRPYNRFFTGNAQIAEPQEKMTFLIRRFFHYELGWELWNHAFRRKIVERHQIRMCVTSEHIAEDGVCF